MVSGMLANIVGAIFSAPLLGKYNKPTVYKILIVISGVLSALIYLVDPANIIAVFALVIILGIVQMATTPILWSMMSDVVDYEKTRSNRSLSGLVFSTNLFAIKLGVALGGAGVGYILAWAGYQGGVVEQSEQVVNAINLLYSVIPGVFFASLAIFMFFYKLDNQKLAQIKEDLVRIENDKQAAEFVENNNKEKEALA